MGKLFSLVAFFSLVSGASFAAETLQICHYRTRLGPSCITVEKGCPSGSAHRGSAADDGSDCQLSDASKCDHLQTLLENTFEKVKAMPKTARLTAGPKQTGAIACDAYSIKKGEEVAWACIDEPKQKTAATTIFRAMKSAGGLCR